MLKTVRVLGTPLKLRWNARLKDEWGDYDKDKALIRIAKAPPLQQREALLHELMHAIEDGYGFEMNHDHLTLMARGLLTVVRDNEGLSELLFGEHDERNSAA